MRARICGVKAAVTTFDYVFALFLGSNILRHSDNLSKTLQSPALSASDAQAIAELTCQTLQRIRDTESFQLFWKTVIHFQEQHDVCEPKLPRKRKAPARHDSGSGPGHHPSTTEDFYRTIYFECLDNVIACIRDRVSQPGCAVLQRLESLLFHAAKAQPYTDDVDFVLKQYGADFEASALKTQLEIFGTFMAGHPDAAEDLRSIRKLFQAMSPAEQANLSQVYILLKLILVVPATNAVSERSASALRRVKTYLRSTMSQARLNHLLLLHCHKDRTDNIHLVNCLQEFVEAKERRSYVFGKFM